MELRPPSPTPPALEPAVIAFDDAHQLWHDAAESYHEPAQFRRHVEGLIQDLRNVTFRLQAAKHDLPGFDTWYRPWQELMRADEQLRWLINARNDIVKHTGLKTDSYARVSLITSYLEPDRILLRLPVGTPTHEVVDRARSSLPDEYRQHMAVSLTRRWAVPGRPQDEVLTLLAHCVHVLDALLLFVREMVADMDPGPPAAFLASVLRPTCMLITPSLIPRHFEADTGEEFHLGTEPMQSVPGFVPNERYGTPTVALLTELSGDPIERGRAFHELARTIFKTDGVYYPTVQLRRPDGRWELTVPLAEDKRDKFLMSHALGARVAAVGHDALVWTAEVWMARPEAAMGPYPDLSAVPDRQEAIVTWVETIDGRREQTASPIIRDDLGAAYLKSSLTGTFGENELMFTDAIRRAWRDRQSSTGARSSQAAHEAPEEDGV